MISRIFVNYLLLIRSQFAELFCKFVYLGNSSCLRRENPSFLSDIFTIINNMLNTVVVVAVVVVVARARDGASEKLTQ
jgi:hypothetical protein